MKLTDEFDVMTDAKTDMTISHGELKYELTTTGNVVVGGNIDIFIKPLHEFNQVHAK